ncbi:MAG TPA: hypothetical protein VNQ74_06840 [Burkholderiaceae bacterium]|nr:hypothetical protein [Burkholderiaceae bacterium]
MRYQFSIRNLLLLIVIASAVAASVFAQQAFVSFLTLAFLLLFVWHRPVLVRFWAVLALGLGSGLAAAMIYRAQYGQTFIYEWGMDTDQLTGWGVGMSVGGLVVCWAFIRNPPAET